MPSEVDAHYHLEADRAARDEAAPIVEFMARNGMLGRQTNRTNFPLNSSSLHLAKDGVLSAQSNQEVCWKDVDEDMRSLSLAFPETLFTLDSSGQDEDLTWRAYYKRGAEQFEWPRTSYAPFDEGKLANPAR